MQHGRNRLTDRSLLGHLSIVWSTLLERLETDWLLNEGPSEASNRPIHVPNIVETIDGGLRHPFAQPWTCRRWYPRH